MSTASRAGGRRVCVAMIARNEEKAVGRVIDEIRAAAVEASILLVDSSTDRTAEIAERKGATVIRQVPPRGYGPAMDAALRIAAERSDVVVTMDCDGTYPAAMIDEVARMVLDGECDLVNASRLVRRPKSMPFANWLANKTFAIVTNFLHGLRVSDVHSGMRAYRSSMLLAIEFRALGAALPVELLIKPARLGYKVREIAIEYRDRIGETTLRRFDSTVWTFRRIFGLLAVGRRVA
jgi:glycosyltransferase involved in cell wall biosynthesis